MARVFAHERFSTRMGLAPRGVRRVGWLPGVGGDDPSTGRSVSLEASSDDAGTTTLILNAYGAALALPVIGRVVRAGRLPNWVRPAGLVAELTGLGLRWLSMSTLKASYSRTLRNAQEDTLIDDGPYALVRHPGYLGRS